MGNCTSSDCGSCGEASVARFTAHCHMYGGPQTGERFMAYMRWEAEADLAKKFPFGSAEHEECYKRTVALWGRLMRLSR